jgi:hypothetical protein
MKYAIVVMIWVYPSQVADSYVSEKKDFTLIECNELGLRALREIRVGLRDSAAVRCEEVK